MAFLTNYWNTVFSSVMQKILDTVYTCAKADVMYNATHEFFA